MFSGEGDRFTHDAGKARGHARLCIRCQAGVQISTVARDKIVIQTTYPGELQHGRELSGSAFAFVSRCRGGAPIENPHTQVVVRAFDLQIVGEGDARIRGAILGMR